MSSQYLSPGSQLVRPYCGDQWFYLYYITH